MGGGRVSGWEAGGCQDGRREGVRKYILPMTENECRCTRLY